MCASLYFILEQTKRLHSILSTYRKFTKTNQWVTKPIHFKELMSHDHTYDENRFKLEIKKIYSKIETSLSGFLTFLWDPRDTEETTQEIKKYLVLRSNENIAN